MYSVQRFTFVVAMYVYAHESKIINRCLITLALAAQ